MSPQQLDVADAFEHLSSGSERKLSIKEPVPCPAQETREDAHHYGGANPTEWRCGCLGLILKGHHCYV